MLDFDGADGGTCTHKSCRIAVLGTAAFARFATSAHARRHEGEQKSCSPFPFLKWWSANCDLVGHGDSLKREVTLEKCRKISSYFSPGGKASVLIYFRGGWKYDFPFIEEQMKFFEALAYAFAAMLGMFFCSAVA
jgi:hypothetical protein